MISFLIPFYAISHCFTCTIPFAPSKQLTNKTKRAQTHNGGINKNNNNQICNPWDLFTVYMYKWAIPCHHHYHHRSQCLLTRTLCVCVSVGKKPEIPIHEYALRDPVYFGDYRSAALTGQDRYYEDLIDYEACFALLQEVCGILYCFCFRCYT